MKFMILVAGALMALAPAQTAAQTGRDAPLCTDRPSKSNNVCTVPQGALQIESDLVNWTRSDDGGTRQDVIAYTSPTVKLGVGPATDVQVTITPYAELRTREASGVTRYGGFGDTFVRVKQRLTAADARLQIGAIPFVKIPTAGRDLGNRAWEGGISVPIQYGLPDGFSLASSPEIDIIEDADGRGRHVQFVATANVGKAVSETVGVGAELWTAQNLDPAGAVRQYSADIFGTWLAAPRLQLDAGANFGLNRRTPDLQVYVGVSTRF